MENDWRQARECKDKSTRIFFPTPSELGTATLAKAICKRCPVKSACLYEALSTKEEFGIWGGTTEKERKRIQLLLGPRVTTVLEQLREATG